MRKGFEILRGKNKKCKREKRKEKKKCWVSVDFWRRKDQKANLKEKKKGKEEWLDHYLLYSTIEFHVTFLNKKKKQKKNYPIG